MYKGSSAPLAQVSRFRGFEIRALGFFKVWGLGCSPLWLKFRVLVGFLYGFKV